MDPIEIRPKRGRLFGLCLFWAGNLAFTAFLLAAPWHQTEWPVILTCVVGGLLLLPLAIGMFSLLARCLTRPTLIRLSASGITDFRISSTEMPWQGLVWQAYPSADLAQSVLVTPTLPLNSVFWPYRVLLPLYQAFDLPSYPILTLGSGLSGPELAAAFASFQTAGPPRVKKIKRWGRKR